MRLLISIFILFTLTANGQTTKRSDWKVIPNNLDESLTRLDLLLGDKFKQDYKGLEEKEAVDRINFVGLGTQIRAMTNKQGRCDLTAIIKEIKRETNQIKIELVTVTTTRPDMKYDKEKYKEGLESWETVDGFQWRKKGEIVQIHIGR
jgi:tRNA/tmRNA/rRNA uracil-C5-methylase (TrmA/RlmC/RlmD family)